MSTSALEARQGLSIPVEVNRSRLHLLQKGVLNALMNPTAPYELFIRNCSAGPLFDSRNPPVGSSSPNLSSITCLIVLLETYS